MKLIVHDWKGWVKREIMILTKISFGGKLITCLRKVSKDMTWQLKRREREKDEWGIGDFKCWWWRERGDCSVRKLTLKKNGMKKEYRHFTLLTSLFWNFSLCSHHFLDRLAHSPSLLPLYTSASYNRVTLEALTQPRGLSSAPFKKFPAFRSSLSFRNKRFDTSL